MRIPDSTFGSAPDQFDPNAVPEVRSHIHRERFALNRETEARGRCTERKCPKSAVSIIDLFSTMTSGLPGDTDAVEDAFGGDVYYAI